VKANEADFLTALEEYKQNKLKQDIAHLIEEAKTTYSSGKSYFSDATPDDDLTNPGILTFNPAMPNVTSNATEPKEGSIEALFDGDVTSYFHSTWTTVPKPNGYHYLQIDLGAAYKQLVMKYTRRERSTNKAVPTLITIQSADNVSGPYKDELDIKITYTFPVAFSGEQMQNWGGLAGFEMAAPHRFIRIVVKETESMQLQEGYPFFYWSELRLYEGKGLDEENSLLAQLKDKNVEQNLLNTISKAEIALADGTANQATYDELKVAYDKFPKDVAAVQKVNANLEAYIRLKEELTSVQEELNEAKTTIENDCKDVADGFVESEQGIQDDIDATAAELDARYDAVELTKESTTNSAELKAAIQRLLSYAITSQKAYENAINRAAYARLTTEITAIQTKLDEAKVKVENDCKDVAAQFAETQQAIQERINVVADSIKTQYEAIKLTEKSAINSAGIMASIEKLLADAAAAQRAYEIAANDAAYKRLTKELAELQDLLYAVERQVDEECKDVAADFVEAELAIQDKLNALKAELKEQHKAVELTEESTISADEIKAEIEKILADAIKAQEAYGPVTGIDGLENLAAQNVKIFTASGKQVNAVVKGQVNILVYPDGTVKRVYVKYTCTDTSGTRPSPRAEGRRHTGGA